MHIGIIRKGSKKYLKINKNLKVTSEVRVCITRWSEFKTLLQYDRIKI